MAKELTYQPLTNLGINGLNTQDNPATLDNTWLTKADNVVLRENGRISFRKGLKQKVAPNGSDTAIGSLIEHNDQGTNKIFASYGTSIYTIDFTSPASAFPSSGADVKHTVGSSTGAWQFVNFNDRLHCFHTGIVPQRYDGSATTDEKWSSSYHTDAVNIANSSTITDMTTLAVTKTYKITTLGATAWGLIGASSNPLVNEIFTATLASSAAIGESIAANEMIAGNRYKIINLGDTNFVLNGAGSNAVDVIFTANAILGIGTGLVAEVFSGSGGEAVEIKTNPTLTTITVDDTTNFHTAGKIIIDEEIISYTGKTSTTFTGCTRGSSGTTATHHLDNAVVTNDSSPPTVTTGEFKPSCGVGFYGRMWVGGVAEEKDVVHYSALLDGDDFTLYSGGGSFDLKNVWGTDEIVAIAPFYGQLAIFGKKNIAIYESPAIIGSMKLNEVIRGVGCISRDSVQHIGDDLVFLSATGLRSLARTTEKDKVPLTDLSLNIKDRLIRDIGNSTNVKSAYVENEGIYLMSFVDKNINYVFDFKHLTPNGGPRVTTWTFDNDREPANLTYTDTYGLLVGQQDGSLAGYEKHYDTDLAGASTYTDASYTAAFETVWVNLGESVAASLLKRLFMVLEGGSGATMGLKWYKDFSPTPSTTTSIILNPVTTGTTSLWGASSSLYGTTTVTTTSAGSFVTDSYYAIATVGSTDFTAIGSADNVVGTVFKATGAGSGSGTAVSHTHTAATHPNSATYKPIFGLREYRTPLTGSAKNIKIAIDIESNGFDASLQTLTLLHKQGKIR